MIDCSYRECLPEGATLYPQERFMNLLPRTVENVDQFKKLVCLCKQIKISKSNSIVLNSPKQSALKPLTAHLLEHLLLGEPSSSLDKPFAIGMNPQLIPWH